MKKILLLAGLVLAFNASAQVVDGTIAPDFTGVDQFGNPHTLSEYLAQGKTVIVDVSATWCLPCWNYHESHTLDDLYYSYGQGGSNEIVVLFVEGDPGTPFECLTDVTVVDNYNTYSRGNWVEGTPYPVINNDDFAAAINLEHFPTILRIDPTGEMYEIGQLTPVATRNNIVAAGTTLAGVTNKVTTSAADIRSCSNDNIFKVKMRNIGTNPITSATIVLKEDGNVVQTKNWTGTTNQFVTTTVTFLTYETNPTSVYSAEIQNINAVVPADPSLATTALNIEYAQNATSTITVNVYTDFYPSEASWKIRNSANVIIASGGPYEAGTEDGFGGGGPDANTVKTVDVTLPAGDDCYRVDILDAYGDGWSTGFGEQHGIEIVNSDGTIAFSDITNEAFTSNNTSAAFKVQAPLGVSDLNQRSFSIYPNPSNGLFSIRTTSAADITVVDVTGKVVYTGAGLLDGSQLNLTSLQSGMYLAKVKTATAETVEKLIVQ